MGKMIITISDTAEQKFRTVVLHKLGHKKGALSIAAERAIMGWARENE